MLIEFSVDNFKSFKDTQTFSMLAGRSKVNTFKANDKLSLLSVAAIFGANASGKSSVIHAISTMRRIVLNKDKVFLSNNKLRHEPFRLSTETVNASTSFDIVFIHKEKRYKYGFNYDASCIYDEYLYEYNSIRPTCVFDTDRINENKSPLNKEKYAELRNIKNKPDNYLYLWLCDQNNNEPAKNVIDFFNSLVSFTGESNSSALLYTFEKFKNDKEEKIANFVKSADFGIDDVSIDQTTELAENSKRITKIITKHKVFDEYHNFSKYTDFILNKNESFGTYKFFSIAAPILFALDTGLTIFYDELDASLHPLLLRKIISLFTNTEINKKHAQLVITCQDTSLLNILKSNKSQIYFTEKNKYGESKLYSLDEFKGADKKEKLQELYLLGAFGAVPNLEGFNEKSKEN